jgi:hypothetical protein
VTFLGRHLYELREVVGTRAALADLLGVGLPTLRSWETGARWPSRAGLRLVWLAYRLCFEPGLLEDWIALVERHRERTSREAEKE